MFPQSFRKINSFEIEKIFNALAGVILRKFPTSKIFFISGTILKPAPAIQLFDQSIFPDTSILKAIDSPKLLRHHRKRNVCCSSRTRVVYEEEEGPNARCFDATHGETFRCWIIKFLETPSPNIHTARGKSIHSLNISDMKHRGRNADHPSSVPSFFPFTFSLFCAGLTFFSVFFYRFFNLERF